MNPEFNELYQEIILDHNRTPRNYGKLEHATHTADGYNPLCGDHYKLYLRIENGIIADIRYEGSGCAISKASASVMSAAVKGMTVAQAEHYFELFHNVVTGAIDPDECMDELGKLAVFAGVAEFPMRVKCATLAWHTLHNALSGKPTAEPS
jgi:nitrogen fixation NifU-like protein